MITSLRSREIDVGIGLTEGWVAGLGRKRDPSTNQIKSGEGYKLLGTYVESPLCWAISTGIKRKELKSVEDLKDAKRGEKVKMGVSRFGSGSHVMGSVLADQKGWISQPSPSETAALPFSVHPLQNFLGLREAVNDATADFFMWEYFTSKRYYSPSATPHPLKQLGEIYTPWPSWQIVSNLPHSAAAPEPRIEDFFEKLNKGIRYFEESQEEAVRYISTELDYEEADATKWLETVKFARDVRGVDVGVVKKTVETLARAGVLAGQEKEEGRRMIGIMREEGN